MNDLANPATPVNNYSEAKENLTLCTKGIIKIIKE
jgi:hypothetical protein